MAAPVNFKQGKGLKADTLNRNNTGVQRSVQPGPAANSRTIGNQVLNDPNARTQFQTPQSAMFRVAQIVDIFDDYLECNMYSPVNGATRSTESIFVAKEYLMRRTPFDGNTISYPDGQNITYTADGTNPGFKRNHDDGSTDADYLVTPTWFIGEEIVIIPIENGVYIGNSLLHWMEMPGVRHWAEI